ncbi:hypothetical protein CDL15_Pgr025163 [Punica granatum]|uniref:tRNA dimethylallyltransferase 2 n=1 Tax=Punica granatum TaxID=22663 RepID=A0A218W8K2_PUNGR|nr:hypothetical protein CDL15_Pgr025163 [Punica granatum]
MDAATELATDSQNPSNGGPHSEDEKPMVVVIMGSTGAGKSKLAIDLAAYFPIEVINADSMQVYGGLDVLTNKVPLDEQKGKKDFKFEVLDSYRVPHHLLGTVNPNEEFTAKMFRDLAIPALVSPFLMDEAANHMDDGGLSEALEKQIDIGTSPGEEHPDSEVDSGESNCNVSFDRLKAIDPIAANRIHPNNKRKNWGRVENFRYRCCFICVDASLPVLDRYVEERVDVMVDSGLLNEVCDIYDIDADYSRGRSNDSWDARVVEPAVEFIRNFQDANSSESPDLEARKHSETSLSMRDLWTQYVCKACGDRVLRGAHEWEQHRQGRSHRKRAARMKKLLGSDYVERDIRRGAGIRI